MVNKCYYGLRNVLISKLLRKDTKYKIHKTRIRPAVMHGCGSWTITKSDEGKLGTLKREMLRKNFSSNCVKEV